MKAMRHRCDAECSGDSASRLRSACEWRTRRLRLRARRDVLPAAGTSQTTAGEPQRVTTAGGIEMVALPGGWFEMGTDDAADDEPDQPRPQGLRQPAGDRQVPGDAGGVRAAHGREPVALERRRDTRSTRSAGATPRPTATPARAPKGCSRPTIPRPGSATSRPTATACRPRPSTSTPCRAGTSTAYSFGDAPADLKRYAWFKGNSSRGSHPVGAEARPTPGDCTT